MSKKKFKWTPVLEIECLLTYGALAKTVPSILISAIMFSIGLEIMPSIFLGVVVWLLFVVSNLKALVIEVDKETIKIGKNDVWQFAAIKNVTIKNTKLLSAPYIKIELKTDRVILNTDKVIEYSLEFMPKLQREKLAESIRETGLLVKC